MIFAGLLLLVILISMHEAGLFLGPILIILAILGAASLLANVAILLEYAMNSRPEIDNGLVWAAMPIWVFAAAAIIIPMAPSIGKGLFAFLLAVLNAPRWALLISVLIPLGMVAYMTAENYREEIAGAYFDVEFTYKQKCFADLTLLQAITTGRAERRESSTSKCDHAFLEERVGDSFKRRLANIHHETVPSRAIILGGLTLGFEILFLAMAGDVRRRRASINA